jgi:hypothetical protein
MKKIFFFLILILMAGGCCKDFYIAPVYVTILKDNHPLYKQNIFPSFFYFDENGKEHRLHYEGADSATYIINQSTDLEMLSFKPCDIYIKYTGLPETDTLEILLDHECDRQGSCGCKAVVLKYMKFNGVLLKDYTIRK